MHEMGIVIHLAKTLDAFAEENHITRIGSVTLSLGEVSGVVNDLFIDAWNYFRQKHPVLSDAQMKIEVIPAITHCDGCNQNYGTVAHGRICPHCGSSETWLIQGNECIIKEIEAETDEDSVEQVEE